MSTISGTIQKIDHDGNTLTIGNAKCNVRINGYRFEAIPGTNHKKKIAENCYIKTDICYLTPDISSSDITEVDGEKIQVVGADGRIFYIEEASYTGDKDIDVSEGTVALEFTAGPDKGGEIKP